MNKRFWLRFNIILFVISIIFVSIFYNTSSAESRQDGVIYFDATLLIQSLPGEGTIRYIADSSSTNIIDKITGNMIAVEGKNNVFKTDQDIPLTYDYIEFFYTSNDTSIEYASGKLKINNNLAEPCYYAYAFIDLQQKIAEQIEYNSYYLDPSGLEVQDLTSPLETGTYITDTDKTTVPFTITAAEPDENDKARDIQIRNQSVTFENGTSVTKKIRLRGTGRIDYRSIVFETSGSFDITICAIAATAEQDRTLAIYDENRIIIEKFPVPMGTTPVATYSITNPGTYYISSISSGIDVGHVTVEEYYKPIYKGEWGSVNNVTITPQKNITDIEEGQYSKDSSGNTYYANTNIYDYYSDWELTGNSLYDVTYEDTTYYDLQGVMYNKFVSNYFQELDTGQNVNPLYFASLTKNDEGTNILTNQLYNGLSLGNTSPLSAVVQGLIDNVLNNNKITLEQIQSPYFNSSFLNGNNSLGVKIGTTYTNMDFPFTFNEETGLWEFTSSDSEQTLRLKKDTSTGNYFFDKVGADEVVTNSNVSNFFPMTNGTLVDEILISKRNNMFGVEMELEICLTEDGKINVYDSDGNIVQKDIIFNIVASDDIWIYVDNKLILDMGGKHKKLAGIIDFATGYSVVNYATDDGIEEQGNSDVNAFIEATSNGIPIENIMVEGTHTYFSYNGINYLANSFENNTLLDGEKHTLKIFYLERNAYSSVLDISFNFPIRNSLQIKNNIDISNANDLFKEVLNKLPQDINFNIKNMATTGTTLNTENVTSNVGIKINDTDISDYNSISGNNTSNGLQPVSGIKYFKILSDGTKSELSIDSGNVNIKNGESIKFSDSFRSGSYIQIEEILDDNLKPLFKTTWQIKEDNNIISESNSGNSVEFTNATLTGDGYIANDNRTPSSSYTTVGNVTQPSNGAIVYRSYIEPDKYENLNLQVEYFNTLQTGSITIEKQVLGDNIDENHEYEFLIEFSNIANMQLEDEIITQTIKLKANESTTISGIPVGTNYRITEVINIALQEIQVDTNIHENISTENLIATGTVTITEEEGNQKFIFVNNDITKGYGKIQITSIDKSNTEQKLSNVTFKLEKLIFNSESNQWIVDTSFIPLEAITNENGVAEFINLDFGKYQISEVKVPEGYNLSNTMANVEINIDNITTSITFENKSKLALPDTGQNINLYITITGIIIFILGLNILKKPRYTPKRLKKKSRRFK